MRPWWRGRKSCALCEMQTKTLLSRGCQTGSRATNSSHGQALTHGMPQRALCRGLGCARCWWWLPPSVHIMCPSLPRFCVNLIVSVGPYAVELTLTFSLALSCCDRPESRTKRELTAMQESNQHWSPVGEEHLKGSIYTSPEYQYRTQQSQSHPQAAQ
jgi:hypothetical protein